MKLRQHRHRQENFAPDKLSVPRFSRDVTFAFEFGNFPDQDRRITEIVDLSFVLLMSTFGVGIAAMLALMGARQWKMGYRIAGGLSLLVAAAIIVAGAWLLVSYL